jgi:putative oxidoreductase
MLTSLKRFLFSRGGSSSLFGDAGVALLRITSGLFLAIGHGLPKASSPGGFIDYVDKLGAPLPTLNAWFAIGGQLVGGLLLASGLLTRVAGLWIFATFIGAAFLGHPDNWGSVKAFFLPADGSPEPAVLYALIGLTFFFLGSGRFGADRFLGRK